MARYGGWSSRWLTEEERKQMLEEMKSRPPRPGFVPEIEVNETSRARCTACGEKAIGPVVSYIADFWNGRYPVRKRQHLACWVAKWMDTQSIVPKRTVLMRRKQFLAAYEAARRKKLVEVI